MTAGVYSTSDFIQTRRISDQIKAWAVLVEYVPQFAPSPLTGVRATRRMSVDQETGRWRKQRIVYSSAA